MQKDNPNCSGFQKMSQCFFDLAELGGILKASEFFGGYETETKLTERTLPCREGLP